MLRHTARAQKAAQVEAKWTSFDTQTFHWGFSVQKTVSVKAAMEFNYLGVQYLLDAFIGSSITLTGCAKGLRKIRFVQRRESH